MQLKTPLTNYGHWDIESLLSAVQFTIFPHTVNAAKARHRGQDNMAAAAGRYYGEGGRATKRQKTEDGGMTTVRISHWP